ncbi:microtubule-associated protein 10 [Lampris incognitus]|uniref:microtubule-associated protein 10 n=1 Tax=Lampris incognitus TaxID=2546036 RepID=UPI0024B5E371|nr:microtubule-associated protein 10 [Lampris incognitus]
MSAALRRQNTETLFSFEILVEYIRVNEQVKVSSELALGVRLLDFPTLIIYQSDPNGAQVGQPGHSGGAYRERDPRQISPPPGGEYSFYKGKSCLFKMGLDSLLAHLSHTPLYATVLDVQGEIPKLVGTFLISLANVVGGVRWDLNSRGISTATSGGERGLVDILDLTGNKIGFVSLRYKLSSLGVSQLPHTSENKVWELDGARVRKRVEKDIENADMTKEPLLIESGQMQSTKQDSKSDLCKEIQMNRQSNEEMLKLEAKQGGIVSVAAQIEQKPRNKMHQSLQVRESILEEDVNVFYPPHLLYCSSDEKKSKSESMDYSLLKPDLESLLVEDTWSEDETCLSEIAGLRPPLTDQRVRHDAKTARSQKHQETNGMTPNVLGETLRQLPLLNALLIELSQLNGQRQQQPLSIHPNLAWLYQPSTEPSVGPVNTPTKAQMKPIQSQVGTPRLKDVHSPKGFSTPYVGAVSQKHSKSTKKEDVFLDRQPSSISSKRKLVYGTTKTFRLRLQQSSSGHLKRHECLGAHTEIKTSMTKDKTSDANKKKLKHSKKKNNHSSSCLDDSINTVMRNIAGDSALQETNRQENKNEDANKSRHFEAGTALCKRDGDSKHLRETSSNSEGEAKSIHIPCVDDGDSTYNMDRNNHHSESYQNHPESDKNRKKTKTWGNSRLSSPKTTHSDSSRGEKEEDEYIDDFTSLEPSDGYSPEPLDVYSPDPLSSPEPALAKTQKSSVCGDLCDSDGTAEGIRKSKAFPVPVKTHSSPQRSLKATHIIRPRAHASALGISSDNDDLDVPTSIRTAHSKDQTINKRIAKRSPPAESLGSSGSKQGHSTMRRAAARGFSSDTTSSFEPQEAAELEDELAALHFKGQYQHISALVANKLPGYTM